MQWPNFNNIYTVPASFLSLKTAFILIAGEILLGVLGFYIIENYDISDAFYMTVITISTVGFMEVEPLSQAGRLFTSWLILINIGIFAYSLSVFSYYVIQGGIYRKMHLNLINVKISKISDHIILCGYGKYGEEIATHLEKHNIQFVIVDQNPEKIETIQKSEEKMLYVEDDATHDETLIKAGIQRARALVSALPDDTDNVFTVLTARQLNPRINIISRAKNPKSQKKLTLAGANHVIMPEQIGGFYMATLISKPGAVDFFSFITNESQSDIAFEEILFEDLPENCQGKSIRDLRIRRLTGANIIGFKNPDGHYIVNPDPDTVLKPFCSFIVLGTAQQLSALKKYFEEHDEMA